MLKLFVPKAPPLAVPTVEVELIPKEAPLSLKGKFDLLSQTAMEQFVLAPLPREIRSLAHKFPKLGETFQRIGASKVTDVEKLRVIDFTLPGLTQAVGLQPVGILPPKGMPVAKLSAAVKQKLPTEIVFARSAGELVDFPISLKITEKGRTEQKITTIVGNTMQLVVKPEGKTKRVRGYVVFKERVAPPEQKTIPESFLKPNQVWAADSPDSYEIPFGAFVGSVLFKPPTLTNAHQPKEIEERLVLQEFEYSDPDGDGIYTAEIQVPSVDGEYEIITVMDYEDPRLTPKEIRLITVVDPEGYVYETDGKKETRIPGAVISLYWLNPEGKQYELWPAKQYQQENPQVSSVTGKYAFVVPEGTYYLKVEAPGYAVYDGKSFAVEEGREVHFNIELKTRYWWLKSVDWKTALLIVMVLLLLYNFYRDKIRERIMKKT
ncbi:MAG: carboxypeptidase regulatory-like domain-containing protein [Candidatus Sungbacteria bacterium]|uniref:Carboxypeptidase regulatory-like domain-containing protein n=1 Tax=Candidatus Sungiibacteriota bacterium TaxID=2750080 RepID=A0A931SCQ1_9BACT|nr:carboxypeptidase regulatory-like domain-containing protein [Candidatus Sungbacteria bacterium]